MKHERRKESRISCLPKVQDHKTTLYNDSRTNRLDSRGNTAYNYDER